MVNHIMFIKANVCKPLAEPKKEKEKKITYTITQDDWEKLALNLSEPLIQPTHLTRMATRKEQALNIPRYATVKVKWNVENGGEWYEGVVTEVLGNGVYMVMYNGERRLRKFEPLTTDTDWHRLSVPQAVEP